MEVIFFSEMSVDIGLHGVISQKMATFITTRYESLKSYIGLTVRRKIFSALAGGGLRKPPL
jgi:hypothetical protein